MDTVGLQSIGPAIIPINHEVWQDGVFRREPAEPLAPAVSAAIPVPTSRLPRLERLARRALWVSDLGRVVDTDEPLVCLSYATDHDETRHVWVGREQVVDPRKLAALGGAGLPVDGATARQLMPYLLDCASLMGRAGVQPTLVGSRTGYFQVGAEEDDEVKAEGEADEKKKPEPQHGWLLGNRWIGPAGTGLQADPRPGRVIARSFHAVGSWEDWRAMYLKLARESWRAALLIGATFAAPLLRFLEVRDTFILHHWGESSKYGKTAVALFAQSAWGSPTASPLTATFNTTEIAVAEVFRHISDVPVFYDEKQVSTIRSDQFIYAVCGLTSRLRGSKFGGVRTDPVTWTTLVRTTGEVPLVEADDIGGQHNRVLQFNGPAHGDEALLSSLYGFTKRNYGHAGWRFLARLAQVVNTPHRFAALQERYQKVLHELTEATGRARNHLAYGATIALGQMMAEYWLLDIDPDEAERRAVGGVVELLGANVPQVAESYAEKALAVLRDHVAAHPALYLRVDPDADAKEEKFVPRMLCGAEFVGDSFNFIPAEADRILVDAQLHPGRVWRDFAANGWLCKRTPGDGQRLKKKIRLYDRRLRAYAIRPEIFNGERELTLVTTEAGPSPVAHPVEDGGGEG